MKILDKFNTRDFSNPGKSNVISTNFMTVSSHHVASSVGIDILKNGGNAVDAALAMSAVLCVAEPHMTGIGGDCFAMLSTDGSSNIKALNASGKSSENSSASYLRNNGIKIIKPEMPDAITIPGAVAGWGLLHKEHGYMPWNEIFQPAINHAKSGIIVHERVAYDWAKNTEKLLADTDTSNIFLNGKKPFGVMENFKNIKLSKTFETIASEGIAGFYNGWVADDMLEKLKSIGGCHTKNDFTNSSAEWVKPISQNYRNIKIHECPPNGQGLVALIILGILENFDVKKMSKNDYVHVFCEAVKIGYFLRDQYLADSKFNKLSVTDFLNETSFKEYAAKIDFEKAKIYGKSDFPNHPDTIYLSVRDKNGMTISFINSLFDTFGSGITAPKSGILFHCRGRGFNLIEGHPNELHPNKKPLHTIIPGMISKKNKLIGSFGVMGGHYQAAGHAYVLTQMIDFGLSPQEALDLPRVFPNSNVLDFEKNFDNSIIEDMVSRGHAINHPVSPIGGGQIILVDIKKNILIGASDFRKDGCAIGC